MENASDILPSERVIRTTLRGLFAANTEGWVPRRLPPPPQNAAATGNPFAGLPTVFTVLGRLGLELQRREDRLEFEVIQ